MAEVALCSFCGLNPRVSGHFLCRSCQQEYPLCYHCGKRERVVPFKLCKRCHEKERARSQSRLPAPARLPSVLPAASEEESDDEEEEVEEETRVRDLEEDGDICLLPGCTKSKFLDLSPDIPVLHDFCCKEHALQFMKSPTPVPAVGESFKQWSNDCVGYR